MVLVFGLLLPFGWFLQNLGKVQKLGYVPGAAVHLEKAQHQPEIDYWSGRRGISVVFILFGPAVHLPDRLSQEKALGNISCLFGSGSEV